MRLQVSDRFATSLAFDRASLKPLMPSVCFYARRGNCNLEVGMSADEQMEKILYEYTCGECPQDKAHICEDTNKELLPNNPPGGLAKVS